MLLSSRADASTYSKENLISSHNFLIIRKIYLILHLKTKVREKTYNVIWRNKRK